MSRIRPPLTTSMTGPETTPSFSLTASIVAPGALVLRPLLRQDQPAVLVLLLEDERLELLTEDDDLVGVDVVADRELAGRDDALGLVADVEQDLVAVDLDDLARRRCRRRRTRRSWRPPHPRRIASRGRRGRPGRRRAGTRRLLRRRRRRMAARPQPTHSDSSRARERCRSLLWPPAGTTLLLGNSDRSPCLPAHLG